MTLNCITDFAAAPSAGAWNGLLARSAGRSVFLRHEFQRAWWQTLGAAEPDCGHLALLVAGESDAPQGIAPFYVARAGTTDVVEEAERAAGWHRAVARARGAAPDEVAPDARSPGLSPPPPAPRLGERVVRLVGGVAVADRLDVIAPAGAEAALWQAALGYWAARPNAWDVIDLHALDPATLAVAQAAVPPGLRAWSTVEETCPAVTLAATWEAYLAGLSKKHRHELRRKLRRAAELPEPPELRVADGGPNLATALGEFVALHRASGPAKAAFMTAAMAGFFAALVAAFDGTGLLEIAVLAESGRAVAAGLSFRQDGRLLLYNSGYDPVLVAFSPGVASLAARMQRAMAEGYREVDFLRGDERYKYEFGAVDQFIHRLIIRK